jgi:hypothetical protein
VAAPWWAWSCSTEHRAFPTPAPVAVANEGPTEGQKGHSREIEGGATSNSRRQVSEALTYGYLASVSPSKNVDQVTSVYFLPSVIYMMTNVERVASSVHLHPPAAAGFDGCTDGCGRLFISLFYKNAAYNHHIVGRQIFQYTARYVLYVSYTIHTQSYTPISGRSLLYWVVWALFYGGLGTLSGSLDSAGCLLRVQLLLPAQTRWTRLLPPPSPM